MNAFSSLLATPPPAQPGADALSAESAASSASASDAVSFLDVMSQITAAPAPPVTSDTLPLLVNSNDEQTEPSKKSSSAGKISEKESAPPAFKSTLAAPPDDALLSLFVQPQIFQTPPVSVAAVKVAGANHEEKQSAAAPAAGDSVSAGKPSKAPESPPAKVAQAQIPKDVPPKQAPPQTSESKTPANATSTSAAAPAAIAVKPVTQPAASQEIAVQSAAQITADGTGGAPSNPEMNYTGDKNEFAGATAQKVPGVAAKDGLPARATSGSAAGTDAGPAARRTEAVSSSAVLEISAKADGTNSAPAHETVSDQTATSAAAAAERVHNLVSEQAVLIRQSGANNLTVSLKLDSNTELNLQLTNHNGQIQAAVHFERGSVAGLDGHWQDLQNSLARQNVHLLPLENRSQGRSPSFNASSDSGSASGFKQTSRQSQGQGRPSRSETPPNVLTVPSPAKTTIRTVSRQSWESWA